MLCCDKVSFLKNNFPRIQNHIYLIAARGVKSTKPKEYMLSPTCLPMQLYNCVMADEERASLSKLW